MAATEQVSPEQVSDASLSYRVVTAIAEEKGLSSAEMDPIHGAVDLDSLDSLVRNSSVDLCLEFSVLDCDVEIRDGSVRVESDDE